MIFQDMLFCVVNDWPIIFLKVIASIKKGGRVDKDWQIKNQSCEKKNKNDKNIFLTP